MKLIILSIFHSNFIFYHKLNKDVILTLLQRSIPTLRYHPHAVFSYCVTVKPPQGIQLCYKPARRPIITWLYCEIGELGYQILIFDTLLMNLLVNDSFNFTSLCFKLPMQQWILI